MNRPHSGVLAALRNLTCRSASAQRGATAVLVAICIVMLCLLLALALNVGHILSVRGELQNAADSGAIAGALELDGTFAKLSGAKSMADGYTERHYTDTATAIVAEPVELGQWATLTQAPGCNQQGTESPDGHRFCLLDETPANAALINAVRVKAARTGPAGSDGGGGVELFASGIIAPNAADGRSTVRASAVAVTGGPCNQDCPKLPFAVRANCLKDTSGNLKCGTDYFVGLSSAIIDTAALTAFSSTASHTDVCNTLRDGACTSLSVPSEVDTNNGASWSGSCAASDPLFKKDPPIRGCSYNPGRGWFIDTVNPTVCDAIRLKMDPDCDGNLDARAKTQIPVVLYSPETLTSPCPTNPSYVGTATVVSFATVTLESARCDSKEPATTVSEKCDAQEATLKASGLPYSSGSMCIAFQLSCGEKDDESTTVGCGWFGTSPLRPVLVR